LRRIAALKARLAGKPELANKLLAAIQKGEKPDPIKDLIEPMERALDALERNQEVKPADAPSDSKPAVSAEHEGDKPGSGSKPKSDKQPAGGASAPAPTEAEKAAATPISFWGYKAKKYQQWTPQDPVPKNPPTGKLPVRLERVIAKGVVREYRFWIYGTFQRDIAHFDSARFDWQAIYKFAAPTQIVKSTQGDYPIYFDDGGAEHDIEYGQLKAPKAAKKKK
jgi:hypothetical protein